MVAFLMMLAACAVDPPAVVGWEPAPEGGREYLIQLAPETLDQLRRGAAVRGTLPLPGSDDKAYYRVTAGRGPVPRRDDPSAAAERADFDQPVRRDASKQWATPATNRESPPPAVGNRWDAPRSVAGSRRIEDLPDALMPVARAVESAAATTSRLGDLPPLDRAGASERPSLPPRSDQEYRPPGLDPRANVAPLPQESAGAPTYSPVDPRPTSGVVPSSANAERRDTNMPSLLPLPDTDRTAAKPADRPPAADRSTPSRPLAAVDATPRSGSQPPSAAVAEASSSSANQPSAGNAAPVAPVAPPESKPWGTLVFVGALLFASLGLNLFLGWTAWEYRRRCESLTMTQNR